jgi:large subunit ribosomal protein L4
MTVQKFRQYNLYNEETNGEIIFIDLLRSEESVKKVLRDYQKREDKVNVTFEDLVETEFTFNILEDSGNYLIHREILRHQISQKQGTVSTKTRSEVRGGGKKPWQQKGTGRARAGSTRSPLWRGGGVIFGPNPKTKTLKLNKKERNFALQTLLYNKRESIIVVGKLESLINESKTKVFCDYLTTIDIYNIPVDNGKAQHRELDFNRKTLVVVSKKTTSLKLATQNLKNVELISASNLNTLSLLKADQILLTPPAVKEIKEIYCD